MHGAHKEKSPSCKRKAAVTPRSHSCLTERDGHPPVASHMLSCAASGAPPARGELRGGYKAGVTSPISNEKPFLRVRGFPSTCTVNDRPRNKCGTWNKGCPKDGWLGHGAPRGAAALRLCQRDQVKECQCSAIPVQAAEAAPSFESLLIGPVTLSSSPCKVKILKKKKKQL